MRTTAGVIHAGRQYVVFSWLQFHNSTMWPESRNRWGTLCILVHNFNSLWLTCNHATPESARKYAGSQLHSPSLFLFLFCFNLIPGKWNAAFKCRYRTISWEARVHLSAKITQTGVRARCSAKLPPRGLNSSTGAALKDCACSLRFKRWVPPTLLNPSTAYALKYIPALFLSSLRRGRTEQRRKTRKNIWDVKKRK